MKIHEGMELPDHRKIFDKGTDIIWLTYCTYVGVCRNKNDFSHEPDWECPEFVRRYSPGGSPLLACQLCHWLEREYQEFFRGQTVLKNCCVMTDEQIRFLKEYFQHEEECNTGMYQRLMQESPFYRECK
jgi:hypothetical protein